MKSDKLQILNVLLIVLAVILVMNVFAAAGGLIANFESYVPNDETMLYYIKNGEYTNLIDSVNTKKYAKPDDSQTYGELCAVAGYFEAASMYHAYQEMGDTEKAEKFEQKMDKNSALLGELSFAKEDINKKLGIE